MLRLTNIYHPKIFLIIGASPYAPIIMYGNIKCYRLPESGRRPTPVEEPFVPAPVDEEPILSKPVPPPLLSSEASNRPFAESNASRNLKDVRHAFDEYGTTDL